MIPVYGARVGSAPDVTGNTPGHHKGAVRYMNRDRGHETHASIRYQNRRHRPPLHS